MAIYINEIGISGSSESEEFLIVFTERSSPLNQRVCRKEDTLYNLACDIFVIGQAQVGELTTC